MNPNRRLLTASVLTTALGVLALSGVASAAAQACNGSPKLCSRTLDKVVLPGSHNAMSSASLGWGIPNHGIAIRDQLKRGIRAMLIDIHYGVPGTYDLGAGPVKYVQTTDSGNPKRQLYLCHSRCELGSTPLVDGLKPIAAFLRSNPREVLVFVNEDYVAPADFAAAAKKAGLLKYIYTGSPTRFPTLAKMISSGQRVVMTSEAKTAPVKWYFEAYKSTLRETPYSFASTGLLTDPAGLAESCRANRGPANGPLFLMNHFVTRTNGISYAEDSAIVNTKAAIVARADACKSARGKMPTILAVNNVELGDVVGAARRLNGLD
ncbi:MAG: hypothetical protein ACKOB9_09170 [Solirubrobacterales bacterium]